MEKLKQLILVVGLLFSTSVFADSFNTGCTNSQNCYNDDVYEYESGAPLIDLYTNYISTSHNLNSNDDSWSAAKDLGFTFDRWGYNWSQARMSTNGCVNFVGRSDGKNSSNCQDYTPQSLPYRNFTLYPLWTDLIRGSAGQTGYNKASKMLFRTCLLYTSPSPRDKRQSRMPSSA